MNVRKVKLPFALDRSNTVVHINGVERGKQCNCYCPSPSCRSPLIAVKGAVREHHFRHAVEIACETGLESAIHLAAKQLIKEKKCITLPQQLLTVTGTDSRGRQHRASQLVIAPGKIAEFDFVEDEVDLGGMRPDIVGTQNGRQLIIEICFRHKVDPEKLAKVAEAGISAIEIDLSDLSHDTDWTALWERINEASRSRWLYNAKVQDVHQALEGHLSRLIAAAENGYERERRDAERRQWREREQLKEALSELKTVSAQERVMLLTQTGEAHPAWLHTSRYFPFAWDDLPDYVNVAVPNGDWIFGCDRRVWQSALYSYFIRKNRKPFSTRNADKWLQGTVGCEVPPCVKTVGIYGRKFPSFLPPELADSLPSSWRTISAYCDFLCGLRMLRSSGPDGSYPGSRWYTVLANEPGVSAEPVEAQISSVPGIVSAMAAPNGDLLLRRRLNRSARRL